MNRDCQKHVRGQIWWVNKELGESKGSVYDKSRPYLIVSNDNQNDANDVLQMIPITSKLHAYNASYVEFNMPERGKNTIVCEQVTSVSKTELGEYIGSLSMPKLREVDRALAHSLDISTGKATIKDIEVLIDDLLLKHAAQVEHDKCNVSIDQLFDGIRERLSTYKLPENWESRVESNDMSQESEQFTNVLPMEHHKKGANIRKQEDKVNKKKPSGFWTEERMLEFLIDYDAMPVAEVIKKWNITKPSAWNYKLKFTKDLNLSKPKKDSGTDEENLPIDGTVNFAKRKDSMTDKQKAEFLHDIETMNTEDVRIKWNLKTKQAVYDRKYKLNRQ